MAWFLVILGKEGGEKEGIKQRRERRDAIDVPPGETHKERSGGGK